MNAGIYKLIFSRRLNALVVVGEICSSQGKAPGSTRALKRSAKGMVQVMRILAIFSSGALLVSTAWAAPAVDALPTGGQVVQGAASISQSGAQMDINQASHHAVINWQSFDVGADAKVHIVQPDQAAVLLNRVVTNKPSEIYGNIDANGQVILVNNNGIVFGKDGSASASSFTATTLDISDQDFMDGKDRYSSNGSQGEIVNHGTIEAKSGGYVALLGAKVTNDGKIVTHNGAVALGAADSIAIPMTSSGKIKMELSASSVNAAVENTKNGVIVTEGGDVYLQAAAANNAMASIKQSGQIDTSAQQAGKVNLLADHGEIKVDGSIIANSNNPSNDGGDIIIGRDQATGKLAKATDVSGAVLESKKGFVETSGEQLVVDGVEVKAGQWLLDPTDITIAAADSGISNSGTNPITQAPNTTGTTASTINATTLASTLSGGTSVIIKTTNASGTGNGDITVASNVTVTGTTDSTLTLQAERDIILNSGVSIARTGTNKLNVVLNSDLDGNGAGVVSLLGTVNSNGGNITIGGGTAGTGAGNAHGYAASGRAEGVLINGGTVSAAGGNIVMNGQGSASNFGGIFQALGVGIIGGSAVSTTGAGNITLIGVGGNGSDTNVGVGLQTGYWFYQRHFDNHRNSRK